MRVRFLLFTLLSTAAFGEMVTGTVAGIDKNQVRLKTSAGELQLQTNEKTTVRKAGTFHDLSPLAAGDPVRVNYYGDSPNLIAVDVSASVTLSGVISNSASMSLTVVPDSKTDATPKDSSAGVLVFVSSATKLGVAKKDLTAGRKVQVVGWDAGEGVIDAEEIKISSGDSPVRPAPPRSRHE